jgi:hypothetical protein
MITIKTITTKTIYSILLIVFDKFLNTAAVESLASAPLTILKHELVPNVLVNTLTNSSM